MEFSRAIELLHKGLHEGLFSAASYAAARGGKIVACDAIGRLSYSPDSPPATTGTLFDVASLTKPVVTALSTMILVENGLLTLNASVGKLLAKIGRPAPHLDGVLVKHLLTHTSGLPPIPTDEGDLATISRNDYVRRVINTPLVREPGQAFTYSDTGYMILLELACAAACCPLSKFAAQHIFEPLSMYRSTMQMPDDQQIWPTAATDINVRPGIVHDPRARVLDGLTGHAGLFTTASDLMRLAEALRTGSPALLSRAAIDKMTKDQTGAAKSGAAIGFLVQPNSLLPAGDLFSEQAYGHSGFTGCLVLIDPVYEVSVVLLTKRVLNTSIDGVPYLEMRRVFLNCAAAALSSN